MPSETSPIPTHKIQVQGLMCRASDGSVPAMQAEVESTESIASKSDNTGGGIVINPDRGTLGSCMFAVVCVSISPAPISRLNG